jgi:hypothetical protein
MASKVMLIRHAEKPGEGRALLGVDETGRPDAAQLSVRGWQRAGALVRFFAPVAQEPRGGALVRLFAPVAPDPRQGIATPAAIFACRPQNGASSLRPLSTVSPLAALLGMTVNHDLGKNDEAALLNAVNAIPGAVLICWSHDPIPGIARKLAGDLPAIPAKWPAKRYDLVWVLDRAGEGWSFRQVGQLLLAGDAEPAL